MSAARMEEVKVQDFGHPVPPTAPALQEGHAAGVLLGVRVVVEHRPPAGTVVEQQGVAPQQFQPQGTVL